VAAPDRRLRENQDLFRTANDRFEERIEEYSRGGGSAPFLCECADERCFGSVDLTLAQYREIRLRQDGYVILPGHPTVDGERVVEDKGDFQIVVKEKARERGPDRATKGPRG
jgi:hypothetical protein